MDKIICVGKNYLEHAQELGDAVPEKPVLFLKPPSVAWATPSSGKSILVPLPTDRGTVHPECEIAVRLSAGGSHLNVEEASRIIHAVTLGLDMTLRDLQAKLKKNGHPWEVSKVFAGSAILGPWIRAHDFPGYLDEQFTLSVSGSLRQQGRGKQMRMSPAECIAYASEFFPLCAGDIVFTGTPAGVAAVSAEDTAELRWGDRLNYRVEWIPDEK
jgi:2-keto-4-pentenoate hydratase/2-oxohepta-3-ene-1,7-dioic acid hydratase in catechol pathway